MLLELFAICLLIFWMWNRQKTARARKMIEKFPGPRSFPIIGTVRSLGGSKDGFFANSVENNAKYSRGGAPFRILHGTAPTVFLTDPKDFEIILGSQKHIDKSSVYKFLQPWLGTGLLTSSGPKWRNHRKIITPAFHFNILEDFLEVFNANSEVLVHKLKEQVNGPGFDVSKYITLYALDNICETAMGVKINAQNDSDSEYIQANRDQTSLFMQRVVRKPWHRFDFLFNMTKMKIIHERSLKILHRTTNSVIKARRAAIERERKEAQETRSALDIGTKKRLAFLDILVEAALDDSGMTEEEIREEVDTFMFAGHDTISSTISFTLWLLSWHQDIQDQVCHELKVIFPDSNEPITSRGLKDLKCMERVIKETLRLYPSAPSITRLIDEDVTLSGGLVIPARTNVNIAILSSHTNPAFWPEPFKFDPDRFSPENIQGRHPYAYVPFSAGPRNCIGQKYAMLEMKATLARILRAYKILPGSKEPNLRLAHELVLISANGIPVKLENRDFDQFGK